MGSKVNITLSAEADTVRKARQYASMHNTTLNQLVRDYMRRLTGDDAPTDAADEFARVARSQAGRSQAGYRFDRGEVHERT